MSPRPHKPTSVLACSALLAGIFALLGPARVQAERGAAGVAPAELPPWPAGPGEAMGSEHSLFAFALYASGVTSVQEIGARTQAWEQLCDELAREVSAELPHEVQVRQILAFLHRRVLRGEYQGECSELPQALDSGQFNCVSATVLFRLLCRRRQVPAVAVATRTHVRCRLRGTPAIEIEPTLPAEEAFGSWPDGLEWRELSDRQLLGKLYYNRGVAALQARQFEASLALLQQACDLDPEDIAAQRNLLAAYNNGALAELAEGKFESASEWVLAGLARDPTHEPLRQNDLHVHQRWAQELCRCGKYRQAVELLEARRRQRPDEPLFDDGQQAVYIRWLAGDAGEAGDAGDAGEAGEAGEAGDAGDAGDAGGVIRPPRG